MSPRVALTTYSVKPRGGVVHTVELAEALTAAGVDTTVIAMGDPEVGFFRPIEAEVRIVPAPDWAETLEERVFSWIDAMAEGLSAVATGFDIVHSQDCISARAAHRVRRSVDDFVLVRTVHHVDDFTTQALIDCQISAILEPDHVMVVSGRWRRQLRDDLAVDAHVVPNGVRSDRFHPSRTDAETRQAFRDRIAPGGRHLFLTVGGIEPRKGSIHLVDAMARLADRLGPERQPVLAVIGGQSFQDYTDYRSEVMSRIEAHGLALGRDIVLLGTVSDDELVTWFHAADTFVFPSLKEGWGLVVLEAQAAGLPVISSDIEVFGEFLTPDVDAIFTRAGDERSLADGMLRAMDDPELTAHLRRGGFAVAGRFTWEESARRHQELYDRILGIPRSVGVRPPG